MAEEVAVWVANTAAEYFAADAIATYAAVYEGVQIAEVVATVYAMREQQRRAANAARDAYNASLQDRYVMLRGTAEPRQVVLGRQRVSGPLAYMGSYGADREHLVFAVLLAAHEIDGVEAVYINDEPAVIDGAGNVLGVRRTETFAMTGTGGTFTIASDPVPGSGVFWVAYGSNIVPLTNTGSSGRSITLTGGTAGMTGTVTIQYQPAQGPWIATAVGTTFQAGFALDASGNGTVTLSGVPEAGSIRAVVTRGAGQDSRDIDVTGYCTVVGATVTITGATAGALLNGQLSFRTAEVVSRMRVRSYLGAPGQTADAGMIAALPGVWTSAHKLTDQAYLVVECDFDPDAFPSGLANISAVVRGAKCFDPRDGATRWTQNPALLMRYVATSPLLGRMPASMMGDTSIAAAANVAEASATYNVNGQAYTRAMYTAGTVVKTGTRAKDVLDDLCNAMVGRWCVVDGQLRMRAGAYVTPLQDLTDAWLNGAASIAIQNGAARGDVWNTVTGKMVDEQRDYQVLDYPRVPSAAYIAADGAELPQEVPLPCVTFSGQAQQVVAAMLRDARQGVRVTLTCNMRAYAVEPFDTLRVTLAAFGWQAKVFEVLDVAWTIDGGIQLQLKETDPSIWALGTSFAATDPAPNTLLPSPWYVPPVVGLACASGTTELQVQADGTVVSTVRVDWTAITDRYVTESGGGVEVRYGLAAESEVLWRSVLAPEGTGRVRLTDVVDDRLYLVKARAYTPMAKGAWCAPVLHRVVGKSAPPANAAGVAGAVTKGRIVWVWDAATEADYAATEIRSADANWGSTTVPPLWRGNASQWPEVVSTTGARTRYVRHVDSSGNVSAASGSATVTVAAGDLVQDGNTGAAGSNSAPVLLFQRTTTSTPPAVPSGSVTYTFSTGAATGIDSWAQTLGSSGGSYRWVTTAQAVGTGTTDAIATGEWATPALLSDATGALASLDTVDTPQLAANAATVVTSGFFAGPYSFSVSA